MEPKLPEEPDWWVNLWWISLNLSLFCPGHILSTQPLWLVDAVRKFIKFKLKKKKKMKGLLFHSMVFAFFVKILMLDQWFKKTFLTYELVTWKKNNTSCVLGPLHSPVLHLRWTFCVICPVVCTFILKLNKRRLMEVTSSWNSLAVTQ